MKPNDFWTKLMREAPGEPSGGTPAGDPAPALAPEPGPDLSFIPQTFLKDGKPDLAAFAEHYKTVTAPKDIPDSYEFAVPADLKFEGVPEDFKVEIDAADPLFGELGSVLKEIGAPKEVGQKMAGLLAKYEAGKVKQFIEAGKREVEALGPKGADRIAEVGRLLDAKLPKEQAEALRGVATSALAIQGIEKLLGARDMSSPSPTPPEPDPYASRYPKTTSK